MKISCSPTNLSHGASFSLLLLILLCLGWESVLAPLRPEGSWLILKAIPLSIAMFGIVQGRRYTYQWSSMMILLYFAEGCVRAWSDTGLSQSLALLEILFSMCFFICAIYYAKLTGASKQNSA